jgi:predicted dehydrogenase
MRVVIVGLGSIGHRHARLLAEREDIQVELCDGSAEVLNRVSPAIQAHAVFNSYADALASAPDVVFLCTPTHLHEQQSVDALHAGCHVFCEKPMTSSLVSARKLLQLASTSSLHVNIGFHLHFHEGLLGLKKIVDDGRLGQLLHVHARVGTYVTLENSLTRYQREVDGSLFGDYTHQFDLVYWLTGQKPQTVFVQGGEFGAMKLSSHPNLADVFLGFDGTLQAHIHLNYIQAPQRHSYELVGTEGWAYLDAEKNIVELHTVHGAIETFQISQIRDDIYRAEHDAFFKSLRENTGQESPPASAIIATAIAEAVKGALGGPCLKQIDY